MSWKSTVKNFGVIEKMPNPECPSAKFIKNALLMHLNVNYINHYQIPMVKCEIHTQWRITSYSLLQLSGRHFIRHAQISSHNLKKQNKLLCFVYLHSIRPIHFSGSGIKLGEQMSIIHYNTCQWSDIQFFLDMLREQIFTPHDNVPDNQHLTRSIYQNNTSMWCNNQNELSTIWQVD